ncbi:TPA: ATP-binding protein [Streptococcus agalactiae]|uniref:ATP-binding protein n=4 Tax=Streptococcus agalactiae TaxID=1311 RepID=A0AAW6XUZ5_STRAG|nr:MULTISPECIES: ATP-binding protein [Streptococcus]EPT68402.1 conjugal transfer protein [Streptococcus agalactiae CCUG 38383]AIF89422.1 conjugal transfer protein [Streptococcus agalactiae]ALP88398.1 conjugal transfer protein [Streptococcus agalactiae]EMA8744058.1 ATP-binding protein [Streptococcus agalactiae]EPT60015.1 conjugal transfer protein [Streptococcus agalactiae CCUG 37430]
MVKKLEYPIDRIHQNLALRKDKVVVAYYRIPNTPITITDSDKKDSHKAKVAQVIKKLAKYKNFDISLIPKDYLLGEKMSDFEADLADDVKELGLETLDFTVDTLTHEMEIPYQFDWLIGVDLGKGQYNANIKEFIYNQFESIASNFASLAGYEVEVDEDWYKEHSEEELLVYSLLSTLKAKRLTDVDLFYYQRMQFLRYVPHTKSEVIANRNMLNVTDTLIKSLEGGFLKLESAYGSSFVSVLPVGRFSTIFNGFHLGELVQRMSFPVELRFQAEFIDKTKLGGTMGRSNTRYDQIMKEAYNTNTVQQDDILMGAYSLKDLMKKVGNKEEIIEYGCYLVVAGSSLNQLKQRRYAILSYFDDMKVNVYEASHDTPYLFQALLYGQDLQKTTRKWNHLVTARGFSELMLFTNTQSGNRIGWYIGRVDNRLTAWDSIDEAIMGSKNLVLFNATVANKEDVAGKVTKNPHVIITGATGQGKSYLAQMIFLHTAQQNVRVLYIDPKRELRQHYLKVVSDPEYARKFPLRKKQIEETNFVTLDSSVKENHGVLDPIVILDKEGASSTAKNMLLYLLKNATEIKLDQTTALTEAISQVIAKREAGEVVGFNQVIEALIDSESDEVQSVGRYFKAIIQNSILELAFSDGDVAGLSYEERVTVLEVADLSLPKDGSDHISDHESNSIALMFALGAFCKHFGERSDDETVEIFDEAWVLMQSSEGKAVIKSMRRVGRSKYNVLMLVSQSVHDAENDDDTTGFGTIFSFYEKSEREDILKHVGLEVTPKNLEWIDNMISGQCLYYDVYGNLNMISIHNIHPDIDPLLKPMKKTVSSHLENKYAS